MMALMVNFGVIASWKVRDLSVARFEAWRARNERSAIRMATPYPYPRDGAWWPDAATYGYGSAGNVSVSASQTDAVNAASLVPSGGDVTIVTTLLDPTRGLLRGHAELSRSYPMLGKLGKFDVSAQTYVVDDKWQFEEMGLEFNTRRRMWAIYSPPPTVISDITANNYTNAAKGLFYTFYYYSPYKGYLAPLANDPDFLAYQGSAPDFHPSLQSFCGLDISTVDDSDQNLIDRIQGSDDGSTPGVAEQMTEAFIALYKKMAQDDQNQIDNAASGTDTSGLKKSIAELQQDISTLEKFLAKLQSKKGSGG